MTGTRMFFLALYGLLALLGLFTAAKAQDLGISIFGFGLIGDGLNDHLDPRIQRKR